MLHERVYELFISFFPKIAENVKMWFPNGKNSIRIRKINGEEFIFTYRKENDWSFETIDRYLENKKAGKRSG